MKVSNRGGLVFGIFFISSLLIQASAFAEIPTCPAGQYWDPGMNMCMPIAPSTPEPTYTWFRNSIINQRCMMCHSTTQGDGDGLDKANFDTYEGVLKVLQPGDPLRSTLYNVLFEKKMPKLMDGQTTAPYLSDAELGALREWISEGANKN